MSDAPMRSEDPVRRMEDPAVTAAWADAEQRIAQNRPYEDAMDADELVALVRSM